MRVRRGERLAQRGERFRRLARGSQLLSRVKLIACPTVTSDVGDNDRRDDIASYEVIATATL